MSRSTKKAAASGTSSDEILRKDRKYIAHGGGRTPRLRQGQGVDSDRCERQRVHRLCVHGHGDVRRAGTTIHTWSRRSGNRRARSSTTPLDGEHPLGGTGREARKDHAPRLNKFHFVNSGTDANETAIRAAMTYTKKKEVLSLELGYHGTTIALSSLGMSYSRHAYPTVPGFRQLPPPYCYRCPLGLDLPRCDVACANLLDDAIKYDVARRGCVHTGTHHGGRGPYRPAPARNMRRSSGRPVTGMTY